MVVATVAHPLLVTGFDHPLRLQRETVGVQLGLETEGDTAVEIFQPVVRSDQIVVQIHKAVAENIEQQPLNFVQIIRTGLLTEGQLQVGLDQFVQILEQVAVVLLCLVKDLAHPVEKLLAGKMVDRFGFVEAVLLHGRHHGHRHRIEEAILLADTPNQSPLD